MKHLNRKIRTDFLHDFQDNYDGTILNDEARQVEETRPQVIDANYVTDEDFDSMTQSNVFDVYGRIVGVQSKFKKKKNDNQKR